MPRILLVSALLLLVTLVVAHMAANRDDHDLVVAELSYADAEAAALRTRPGVVEDWMLAHPGDELNFRFKIVAVDGAAYAVDVDAVSGAVVQKSLSPGRATSGRP